MTSSRLDPELSTASSRSPEQRSPQEAARQRWMAVLAKATLSDLEAHFASLEALPDYHMLRSPEIGLAMVRGRVNSTGHPFNLGEMTITRCVIQLSPTASTANPEIQNPKSKIQNPTTGFGYVAGRSHRHAELAAFCDALLQRPDWHDVVQAQVIEPLEAIAHAKRAAEAAEVESTRVNFFTMLRGEG